MRASPGLIPGMKMLRRLILAIALAAGIAPAFAQAPPPVPALPDTERRTTYSISASTCACSVGFQLYGDSTDYGNWLEVFIDGVLIPQGGNWTLSSPTGSLATIPRPITDAVLTFTTVRTGTVQIVGAQRPRRASQFPENRGVAARDFNQVLSSLTAQLRENWDKTNDVTGRAVVAPPGETLAILPKASSRANMNVCFDSGGNLVPCVPVTSGSFAAGSGIIFTGTGPTTISTASVINPVSAPQGRLTLTSATAVMTTSVASATRVYYTPSTGTSIPIYDGSNLQPVTFTEVFQDVTDTAKSPAAVVPNSNYDVFCWIDVSTPRCTRGPAWTNDSTRSAGTALVLVNGIFLNSVSITNGPAASRGTYVGTIRSNSVGTINYIFGGIASGGTAGDFGVWNAFNRVPVKTIVGDSTVSWTHSVATTWRAANNSATMRISFVVGLILDGVTGEYHSEGSAGGSTIAVAGVGLNSTTAFCGTTVFNNASPSNNQQGIARCSSMPALGYNFLSAIEYNTTTNPNQWFGAAAVYAQTGLHGELWQ